LKVTLVCVGEPGRLLAPAIAEYERRAARYWSLEIVAVKAERATKSQPGERVRAAESERLLARVPPGAELIALTRTGEPFDSAALASYLGGLAVRGHPGVAFLIGGAFGFSAALLARADRRVRLSAFTLPHELARLVIAEQLYRAGTILRGEPYHKGGR
jgi:23S rRNA (pseudouridine1915-N3)-methyltransferase